MLLVLLHTPVPQQHLLAHSEGLLPQPHKDQKMPHNTEDQKMFSLFWLTLKAPIFLPTFHHEHCGSAEVYLGFAMGMDYVCHQSNTLSVFPKRDSNAKTHLSHRENKVSGEVSVTL